MVIIKIKSGKIGKLKKDVDKYRESAQNEKEL
jgi:hypothetical protein